MYQAVPNGMVVCPYCGESYKDTKLHHQQHPECLKKKLESERYRNRYFKNNNNNPETQHQNLNKSKPKSKPKSKLKSKSKSTLKTNYSNLQDDINSTDIDIAENNIEEEKDQKQHQNQNEVNDYIDEELSDFSESLEQSQS